MAAMDVGNEPYALPSDDEEPVACASDTREVGSTGDGGTAEAGAAFRATGRGGSAGQHRGARLGLNFSGSTSFARPPGIVGSTVGGSSGSLSWKDGRFSDWPVRVGAETYHLHAFLLARASLFFDRHISVVTTGSGAAGGGSCEAAAASGACAPVARGSDLTEVLPPSCHAAFEDALDFIYSENQATFEAPASKALLLLKIADILGISGLFEAMGQRIEGAFADTAPLLLEQYCRFHVAGTDDGAALQNLREGAVELVVRKFQPFLSLPEMRAALLRLPDMVLVEILEADDLLVASEDVVFDFVLSRSEAAAAAEGAADVQPSEGQGSGVLWRCVRWPHVSATTFKQALTSGRRLTQAEVIIHALSQRVALLDLGGAEMFASPSGPTVLAPPPRHAILPPGVPPPTSTEIDFCFHYSTASQFASGESLRSQPKRVGDLVLRVLVFPCGTDTGVAHGSLSVFLEAVPQPHWPRDWEFTNIRYALACVRWPSSSGEPWAAKRKSDLWTFKANRLDRGWHDFLSPGEVHRFLGPEGFVCVRGSLDPECLVRAFLFSGHGSQGSYPGHTAGEAAGSSASRRSWAPPRLVAAGSTAAAGNPGGGGGGGGGGSPVVVGASPGGGGFGGSGGGAASGSPVAGVVD